MIATGLMMGIVMATFGASGLFFYKFWRASHDRFFMFFAISCWLIAFERVVAIFIDGMQEVIRTQATEASAWVYLLRLAAFAIILVAIIDRNRRQG